MLRLRRHVVFVVFGQNFGGCKLIALIQFTLRHNALTFFEQVGQHALVNHRHFIGKVCHHKLHVFSVFFEAALFDHTANPKSLTFRRFTLKDLCGREEENQVALKSIQNKHACSGQCSHGQADQ